MGRQMGVSFPYISLLFYTKGKRSMGKKKEKKESSNREKNSIPIHYENELRDVRM